MGGVRSKTEPVTPRPPMRYAPEFSFFHACSIVRSKSARSEVALCGQDLKFARALELRRTAGASSGRWLQARSGEAIKGGQEDTYVEGDRELGSMDSVAESRADDAGLSTVDVVQPAYLPTDCSIKSTV